VREGKIHPLRIYKQLRVSGSVECCAARLYRKCVNVYNKAATAPKNGSETARSRINVYW
jgi:hypothetical protein